MEKSKLTNLTILIPFIIDKKDLPIGHSDRPSAFSKMKEFETKILNMKPSSLDQLNNMLRTDIDLRLCSQKLQIMLPQ